MLNKRGSCGRALCPEELSKGSLSGGPAAVRALLNRVSRGRRSSGQVRHVPEGSKASQSGPVGVVRGGCDKVAGA